VRQSSASVYVRFSVLSVASSHHGAEASCLQWIVTPRRFRIDRHLPTLTAISGVRWIFRSGPLLCDLCGRHYLLDFYCDCQLLA
jgi:hypothetical protein